MLRHDLVVLGVSPSDSTDPDWPLYARHENSTGGRLATMLGWSYEEYHAKTFRVNACYANIPTTRRVLEIGVTRVFDTVESLPRPSGLSAPRIIVLGSDIKFLVMAEADRRPDVFSSILYCPHPSGRNRFFNNPLDYERICRILREFTEDVCREDEPLSVRQELKKLHEDYPSAGLSSIWGRLLED